MRGGAWSLLAFVMVFWSSCGLETVPSLNPPDVNYNDTLRNGPSTLSFVHLDSRYESSDFSGYQIFYKIYPVSATGDFARLLADRTSLSASPTVAQLGALGYQSFSFSNVSEGTSAGTEGLLVQNLGDNETVTLDFSQFLNSEVTSSVQPLLLKGGVLAPKPYLYRAPVLVGTPNQTFGALRKTALVRNPALVNGGLPIDVAATITDTELTTRQYEINVFIAAWGMTPTLVEVSSSPVPWGVIRTIK